MLITRRGIFLGASASGFALMLTGRRAPALMFEGVPLGKAPGDEGYKHGLYHDAYQKLFGDLGAAAAATASAESPSGGRPS